MPGDQFDGTANTRANYQRAPHSVPAAPRGGGPDGGGTSNLRASPENPASSLPASGPGPVGQRLPVDTFADRSV